MSTFEEEIVAARATIDPDSYISQVKTAVRNEFARIDDSAVLDDTNYFNHSAVPDFIIEWPDRSKRRLYLRNSYESIVASGDAVRFNPSKPVVLALSSDDHQGLVEGIAQQSQAAPETLISNATALDAITEGADRDRTKGDRSARNQNPVAELIRSNLARGGRGLLTVDRVSDLLDVQPPDPSQSAESYLKRLEKNFSPESVARISQTALLVQVSLSGDVSKLADNRSAAANLTVTEIGNVLPWVLENPGVTDEPDFWEYLGSIVGFAHLLQMRDSIEGRDLSRLVRANLSRWSGKRAYIGLESLAADNPSEEELKVREDGVWSIIGPTLGVNFQGSRLHLAPSGTAIRGRDGKSAVLWPDLSVALSSFKVSAVNLKGIARSIQINAEESDDVSEDIDAVTNSVDDTYYVGRLGLAFPAADEDGANAPVEVNFDSSIVASERPVSLFSLALAALRLLRYREPVDRGVEMTLLGVGPATGTLSGPSAEET
ncbi:hypothetical protein [Mycobacterium sp. Aquia_213]|uniref:hypothetical protein n=1 Tax=Mycobacterium sp. Aquia_213 TaxID=2991728 RepID=UPI00226E63E9|nr:hypothetical protein [Mycobacterium sp. Aquia_213]WAC93569.1 hypothetical protein LMQ14_10775 [Mycobacterium sp. Aquia_213]